MMRSSKPALARPLAGPALAARWGRLLLSVGLLLVAAACSTTPANIGVGLPSVDPTTGAYLVDTLTLKASTVLRDSVITSTSNYLLVGRYVDPELGTIKASSYATLNLGSAFTPDRAQVADSIVLVLKPDTYRYGDTTKTQTLVEVRKLLSFLPVTSYAYASPRLTDMSGRVDFNSPLLNRDKPVVPRRARPNLNTLRIPLDPTFGQALLANAKDGLLTTQDQLDSRYPGLALLPGANDNAALVRLNASSADQAVILYYHDPTDPTTALSHTFALTSRHFYQAEATRSGALTGLTPNGQLEASRTGQRTYIEGLLGLQTKIEIPYLADLRTYGQRFIITNATITAEVPANTLGSNLAPPQNITVIRTNPNNQLISVLVRPTQGVPDYSSQISSVDGIQQAGYSWSVLGYCQDVLNGAVPNHGMLVNTANPTLPERVVLGGPRSSTNKLKLRLYLIRND